MGSERYPLHRSSAFLSASMARLPWRAAAGVAALMLTANNAAAYCRTTTCDIRLGQECAVNPRTKCPITGVPLFWPDACVTFGVHHLASPKQGISFDEAEEAAELAFRTWISAKCDTDGQHPSIGVVALGSVECDKVQYNYPPPGQDFPPGPNANIIVFRDDFWPYLEEEDAERTTLALTTITYLRDTGEIVDADIEVNSANVRLSTGNTNITNDLQAILAHEAGHFFGLAHSEVKGATMNERYNVNVGDATFRTLSDDDRRGICDLYPPGAVEVGDCRGEGPRFGFSRYCHTPVEASAGWLCSAGPAISNNGASSKGVWLAILGLVGAVIGLGTRRRRGT